MPARLPGQSMSTERYQSLTQVQRQAVDNRRRQRSLWRRLNTTTKRYTAANYSVIMCHGVHVENDCFVNAIKRVQRVRLQREKKPTNNTAKWCAIEIEFIAAGDESVVLDALANAGLGAVAHLKEDGSLSGTEERPNEYELVLCAELDRMPEYIARACKVLRREDIDGSVNKTCGLHIHLDMRNYDVSRAYRNLVYSYDGLLSKLVPKTRIDNTYCKPPETSDFEDACSEDDRYRAINACAYSRHNTLEVRIFAGSVNAEKITQYLRVVSSIAYAPKTLRRNLTTVSAWSTEVEWPDTLTEWVKARAADFGHML